jgi:hypothetical protein
LPAVLELVDGLRPGAAAAVFLPQDFERASKSSAALQFGASELDQQSGYFFWGSRSSVDDKC